MLNSAANLLSCALPGTMPGNVNPPQRNYTPLAFPLNFTTEGKHPAVKEAHRAVQWWLNDALHGEKDLARWIVLYGNTGTGKSHLARNAHKLLREFKRRTLYRRATDMAADLRAGKYEKIDMWAQTPFLIIDDFGAEMKSDFLTAQWYDLLDQRLGKWTIITTNLTPSQVSCHLDPRIASRFYDGMNKLVDLTSAPDYRQQHNQH